MSSQNFYPTLSYYYNLQSRHLMCRWTNLKLVWPVGLPAAGVGGFLYYSNEMGEWVKAPTDPNSVGVRISGAKTIFSKYNGFEHFRTSTMPSQSKTII